MGFRLLWTNAAAILSVFAAAGAVVANSSDRTASPDALLNVSYDPTRELYADLNAAFATQYQRRAGQKISITQSHGGSSRQARAVADGLAADVVTLALYTDVDLLRKRGLVADGWADRLPNHSTPYTSTIVFVVRRGNPLRVRDWPDLLRPGVAIVTANPKTSGNGKLAFLAAWGSVLRRGGDENAARAFVAQLYEHVVVSAPGARTATTEFAGEKVGDVQLTWENEAILETSESGGELEVVYPPTSIRAEPYVAWVDANVARRKTLPQARAYLEYLFTPEGQEIVAEHGYRPYLDEVSKRHLDRLPPLDLFPVTLVARDWDDAARRFFADGGVFDEIRPSRGR